MDCSIVAMLDNMKSSVPLFGLGELYVESMNEVLVDQFSLAICLWVEEHIIFEIKTQK